MCGKRGNCPLPAFYLCWWSLYPNTPTHWPKVSLEYDAVTALSSLLFVKGLTSAAGLKSSNQLFFHCSSLHLCLLYVTKSSFVGAMFLIRKFFVVQDGLSYIFLLVSETNLEILFSCRTKTNTENLMKDGLVYWYNYSTALMAGSRPVSILLMLVWMYEGWGSRL